MPETTDMRYRVRLQLLAAATFLAACSTAPARQGSSADSEAQLSVRPTGFGPAVDRDIARVRAATNAYHVLDSAVVAGYSGTIPGCIDHPPYGAMGFHHPNRALYDDKVEVERPEMLVYGRTSDGHYKLNGVEYIVPYSAWSRSEPPTIMGQSLERSDALEIWYRHVWIWEENPSGLFADWNPRVKC